MYTLNKIIYATIFIIIFVMLFKKIFDILEIDFNKYGNFLMWTISLIIMFVLLPSRSYVFD